jgi:hypothetical protein
MVADKNGLALDNLIISQSNFSVFILLCHHYTLLCSIKQDFAQEEHSLGFSPYPQILD